MRGEYQHNIDAKGRLIFPIKLREALGEHFVIFKGLDNCINVYSQEKWAAFEQQLAALPSKARKVQRFFSANFECEPDAQGRIVLPQRLRKYAGLDKDVVIIGVHDRAEIWSADAWQAQEEEEMTPEKMSACMEALGF